MITNYFIKKSVKKWASEENRGARCSVPFSQVKSVLVLYNKEDQEALRKGLDTLKAEGKALYQCIYVDNKAQKIEEKSGVLFVDKQSLSRWGFPSEELVSQVAAVAVDLLIDLTRPSCYAMQYVALRHPATFKVGIKYPEQEWYDLGVVRTEESDIAFLFDQILFYLRAMHA